MHGQNEESDDGDDDFAYGEFDARRVISNSTIFNQVLQNKKKSFSTAIPQSKKDILKLLLVF